MFKQVVWFSLEKPLELLEKVKMAKSLFQQVVEVSQILNSIFSLPVLFLFTANFFLGTFILFYFINSSSGLLILGSEKNITQIKLVLIIGIILIIFKATDLPVKEVFPQFPHILDY